MTWTPIDSARVPTRTGLYSLGAAASGPFLFTAGIVALDANGDTVGHGDARAQTAHVLDMIRAILSEAGADFSDVIQTQIYLRDMDDYAAMNEVYRQFFSPPFPARFCVQAKLVKPDWLVEIAAIAALKEHR